MAALRAQVAEGAQALSTLLRQRRRHKAELLALEAQMQAKLETLARVNQELTRRLEAETT